MANPLVGTLADTFSSTSQNTTLWTASGSGMSQPDGTLHALTQSGQSYYQSVTAYALRDSAIVVQLVQPLGGGTPIGNTELNWRAPDNSTTIQFLVQAGSPAVLQAYKASGGTGSAIGSVTYSAIAHKWLRLRYANPGSGYAYLFDTWDGTTYAADGVTPSWVQQFSDTTASATISPDTGYASVGVNNYSSTATSAAALFDNVNTLPARLAPAATALATATVAVQDRIKFSPAATAPAVATVAVQDADAIAPAPATGQATATVTVRDAVAITPTATAPSSGTTTVSAGTFPLNASTATAPAVGSVTVADRIALAPSAATAPAVATVAVQDADQMAPAPAVGVALGSAALASPVAISGTATAPATAITTVSAGSFPLNSATATGTASGTASVATPVAITATATAPALGSASVSSSAFGLAPSPATGSATATTAVGVAVRFTPSATAPALGSASVDAGSFGLATTPATGAAIGTATVAAPVLISATATAPASALVAVAVPVPLASSGTAFATGSVAALDASAGIPITATATASASASAALTVSVALTPPADATPPTIVVPSAQQPIYRATVVGTLPTAAPSPLPDRFGGGTIGSGGSVSDLPPRAPATSPAATGATADAEMTAAPGEFAPADTPTPPAPAMVPLDVPAFVPPVRDGAAIVADAITAEARASSLGFAPLSWPDAGVAATHEAATAARVADAVAQAVAEARAAMQNDHAEELAAVVAALLEIG